MSGDRGPMGIFEGYGDDDAGPDGTGETNPPAFPVQDRAAWQYPGMTLRDWFAGQALIGSFQNETDKAITTLSRSSGHHENDLRASYCYEIADAMLAARRSGDAA